MKKFLVAFLLCLITFSVGAQPRKKVGVVLSGGGAKGVAHVSALKVIEEAGIPIDIVVGTSMGAIVGGLYSIGYTPAQLDSLVRKQDWTHVLTDRTSRRQKTFQEKVEAEEYVITLPFRKKLGNRMPDGIVKGKNINKLFTDLAVGYHDSIDFNTLPIPFACVGVDLVKCKEVVFREGSLIEAMRASMAIPAVFTPIRKDGMVLVDGGLLNNFPVDVAIDMGAEIIIGVDVQSSAEEKEKLITLIDMVNKLTDMTGKEKYEQNLINTDVHIKVDVKGYNAASFDAVAIDTLIARGEIAAMANWDNLKAIKKQIGINDEYQPEPHGPYTLFTPDNPIFVRNISFNGLNKKDTQKLSKKAKVFANSYVTLDILKKAVDNLYSLQAYTNINYNLTAVEDGYDLEFILEDLTPNHLNLGIRFDSEEIAAVQLAACYQFNTTLPTKIAVTGRLGQRASVKLDYMILPNPLRSLNFSYMFQYNDININFRGSRAYNTTYRQHLAEFGYANVLNRDLKYSLGLRYEYYDYSTFLSNNIENAFIIKAEDFFSYFASIQYETQDKKTFPTKGLSLKIDASVYTDNLSNYKNHAPFTALSLWWEGAFRVTNRFALLPSFYGRVLIGEEVAYPFMNVLGGEWPGRYMRHQIPFVGISYMEIFDNSVVVGQLQLRQRMGKSNYMWLTTNYGLSNDNFGDLFGGKRLFGIGIGYGYDSVIGPLRTSFNFSNRTKKVGFFANIGYTF